MGAGTRRAPSFWVRYLLLERSVVSLLHLAYAGLVRKDKTLRLSQSIICRRSISQAGADMGACQWSIVQSWFRFGEFGHVLASSYIAGFARLCAHIIKPACLPAFLICYVSAFVSFFFFVMNPDIGSFSFQSETRGLELKKTKQNKPIQQTTHTNIIKKKSAAVQKSPKQTPATQGNSTLTRKHLNGVALYLHTEQICQNEQQLYE